MITGFNNNHASLSKNNNHNHAHPELCTCKLSHNNSSFQLKDLQMSIIPATIERFLTTTPWLSPRYGVDNFICYRQMHSTKDRYIAMSLSVPLNRQENGVKTQKSKKNVCLLDGWPIRKLALWVLNVRFSFLIVPARSASSNWQTTQLNLFVQMVTDSPADVTIH